jgi:hypothetical protein
MAADARITAAWDRAAAPISRYFDLIEALGTGGDERQIVRSFRSLDKELSSAGIRSESSTLYRSGRPTSLWLVTAMVDDLAARVAVASGRLSEAVQEIGRRFDQLNARSARFAKVGRLRDDDYGDRLTTTTMAGWASLRLR